MQDVTTSHSAEGYPCVASLARVPDEPAPDPLDRLAWLDLEMTGLDVGAPRHRRGGGARDGCRPRTTRRRHRHRRAPAPRCAHADGRLRPRDAHPLGAAPGDRGVRRGARRRRGARDRVPARPRAEPGVAPDVRELDRRRPPLPPLAAARSSTSTSTTAASTCRRSRSSAGAGTPRPTASVRRRTRRTARSTTCSSRSPSSSTTGSRCSVRPIDAGRDQTPAVTGSQCSSRMFVTGRAAGPAARPRATSAAARAIARDVGVGKRDAGAPGGVLHCAAMLPKRPAQPDDRVGHDGRPCRWRWSHATSRPRRRAPPTRAARRRGADRRA